MSSIWKNEKGYEVQVIGGRSSRQEDLRYTKATHQWGDANSIPKPNETMWTTEAAMIPAARIAIQMSASFLLPFPNSKINETESGEDWCEASICTELFSSLKKKIQNRTNVLERANACERKAISWNFAGCHYHASGKTEKNFDCRDSSLSALYITRIQ